MEKYNRVNLVFRKNDENDDIVYKILSSKKNKTHYVCEAIQFYEENRLEISKKMLIALIQEISTDLNDIEIKIDDENYVQASDITTDMMDYLDF